MIKKLFIQLKNEWRGNLWLAAELLVVSVVTWFIVVRLYHKMEVYFEPRGFNTEHCYKVMMGELTDKSAGYRAYTNLSERTGDIREMVERLRRRPEVEVVSLSHHSHPYNGSNSNIMLKCDTLITSYFCLRLIVTPDFVRVFQYHGSRGETPEQLAGILERGEFLASDNLYEHSHHLKLTPLIGKEFYFLGDTTRTYKLGAALVPVRYDDFRSVRQSLSMVYDLNRMTEDFSADLELCVRVRADQDVDFISRLKADSEKQFKVGNIYIAEVVSFKDIRRLFQQRDVNQLRNFTVGISFLLLNIFLGLLGTFWFRTQQRKCEIALHLVHGATPRQVFLRLMAEGVLILTLVTLPALVIDYLLAYFEITVSLSLGWGMLSVCALITYCIILLMMLVGIGIPAYKAMKVHPVEALHDE